MPENTLDEERQGYTAKSEPDDDDEQLDEDDLELIRENTARDLKNSIANAGHKKDLAKQLFDDDEDDDSEDL